MTTIRRHRATPEIKALLPAGDFILGANAYPGSTGAYDLTSAAATTNVTGCEDY